MTYFDLIPEELKIIIAVKINDPYLSTNILNLNENIYFRILCINNIKVFNVYPVNMILNNRNINWLKIYEEIKYILYNKYSGNNKYLYIQSVGNIFMNIDSYYMELFLVLLWTFQEYYKIKDNINDFKYTNILYKILLKSNIYIALEFNDKLEITQNYKGYYINILYNFNDYLKIYLNKYMEMYKLKIYYKSCENVYSSSYTDDNGYIITPLSLNNLFLVESNIKKGIYDTVNFQEDDISYIKERVYHMPEYNE